MNTEDMDYYEYEESKKRFTPKKIIKFIFSAIAAAVIIAVFVLIALRIQLLKIPADFQGVTWTDEAKALYDSGEFDYISYPLGETYGPSSDAVNMMDTESDTKFKVTEGLYHVSNIALSEKTGEVQFTVRYNKRSTVNVLMDTYGLTERPEGEVFIYRLKDDSGNVYTDYVFAEDSNLMQEYRRVIFKNVDLSDIIPDENPALKIKSTDDLKEADGKKLTLEIFYGDDVSYSRVMNATFTIYNSAMPYKDIEAPEKGECDLKFNAAPYYESKLGA